MMSDQQSFELNLNISGSIIMAMLFLAGLLNDDAPLQVLSLCSIGSAYVLRILNVFISDAFLIRNPAIQIVNYIPLAIGLVANGLFIQGVI